MSMDPQTLQMLMQYEQLMKGGQGQGGQGAGGAFGPRQASPGVGAAGAGTQLLQALMMRKRIAAQQAAQNGGTPPSVGGALQNPQGPAPGPFPGPGNYDPSQGAANAAGVS